jgi:hypothetical protein
MNLSGHFFMMASCSAREGDTLYFWRDTWDLGVHQWKFRQLFSFALNKNISLKALKAGQIERNFWCPLSIEASDQLQELQTMLNNIQISYGVKVISGHTFGIQMNIFVTKDTCR